MQYYEPPIKEQAQIKAGLINGIKANQAPFYIYILILSLFFFSY